MKSRDKGEGKLKKTILCSWIDIYYENLQKNKNILYIFLFLQVIRASIM